MALKRRVEKTYSLQEMLSIISEDFIKYGSTVDIDNPIHHYVLSPTCFTGSKGDDSRWLMCDSRTNRDGDVVDDELPLFYGATILEAVTKCFVARKEWEQPVVLDGALKF